MNEKCYHCGIAKATRRTWDHKAYCLNCALRIWGHTWTRATQPITLKDSQDDLTSMRLELFARIEERLAANQVGRLDVEMLLAEVKRLMSEIDEYRRITGCPASSSR